MSTSGTSWRSSIGARFPDFETGDLLVLLQADDQGFPDLVGELFDTVLVVEALDLQFCLLVVLLHLDRETEHPAPHL
ncbi:hypothetical protein ACIQTZ_11990 [Paenarthrobacter sp. NPDC090520]|uniref:hypothetical protein n=1 Tax=Paenarthrobacter sp. NPDC090520 TaxID=3364382 RepID=UPI003810115A